MQSLLLDFWPRVRSFWASNAFALWVLVAIGLLTPVLSPFISVALALGGLLAPGFRRFRADATTPTGSVPPSFRRRWLHSFVYAIAAASVMLPFWLHAGVPAYNQDWGSFPLFRAQMASWVSYAITGWQPDGLGHPNAFPFIAPLQVFAWELGRAFGAGASIRILLFMDLFLAGVLAARLLKRIGLKSELAIVIGAVFYQATPVVLNEISAGHWGYLFAYALLPGIIAFADRLVTRPRIFDAAVLALLVAAAGSQPQFLIFSGALVVALLMLRANSISGALALIASLVVAYAMQSPGFYPLLAHVSTGYLSVERANAFWMRFQSVPPAAATGLIGYIGRYDTSAYGGVGYIIPAAIKVMLSAAILMPKGKTHRVFDLLMFCAAAALLIEMGLDGPLSMPLQEAFAKDIQFTVIRELYDFSVFPALLAMSGLAFIIERTRRAGILLGSLLALGAIISAAQYSGFLKFVTASPSERSAIRDIAQSPSQGRVLWLPAPAPLGDERHSGLDPMTIPIGLHASLQGNLATPVTGWIQAGILRGHLSKSAMKALDVQWIVVRHDTRSEATNIEPSLKAAVAPFIIRRPLNLRGFGHIVLSTPRITLIELYGPHHILSFAKHSATVRSWSNRAGMEAAANGNAVRMIDPPRLATPALQNMNPVVGPAPTSYWFWLDPRLDNLPRFGQFVLNGTLCASDNGRILVNGGWRVRKAGCYAGSMVAVDPGVRPSKASGIPTASAQITATQGNWISGTYAGTYRAAGYATLIDASQYDPRWECVIDGGRALSPFMVNAYEMAFVVPPGDHHFELLYGPTVILHRLFSASAVIALLCLIAIALGGLARRTQPDIT